MSQPGPQQEPHLLQPLQGSFARIGDVTGIVRTGQIAIRQASIIMVRPDQSIEIDFDSTHFGNPCALIRPALSETWLACGQAQ